MSLAYGLGESAQLQWRGCDGGMAGRVEKDTPGSLAREEVRIGSTGVLSKS